MYRGVKTSHVLEPIFQMYLILNMYTGKTFQMYLIGNIHTGTNFTCI